MKRLSAFHLSLLFHASLVGTAALIYLILSWSGKSTVNIPIKVIENAQSFSTTLKLQPPKIEPEAPKPEAPKPEVKKVFGVSRKSIQAADSDTSAISVKAGNTVAKEQDNLELDPNDEDSLPIPADDFLITEDVSRVYAPSGSNRTDEARREGTIGVISVSVLIDTNGLVREAKALNELPHGLTQRAIELALQFRFRPAKIGDQTVAVRRVLEISFKAGS